MEFLSEILGRCHDVIMRVEQLHVMKSVSDGLMSCSTDIFNNLEDNQINYNRLKESIEGFLKTDEFA